MPSLIDRRHVLHRLRAFSPSSQIHHSHSIHLYTNNYLQDVYIAPDPFDHPLVIPSQKFTEMEVTSQVREEVSERLANPDLFLSLHEYINRTVFDDINLTAFVFHPRIYGLAGTLSLPLITSSVITRVQLRCLLSNTLESFFCSIRIPTTPSLGYGQLPGHLPGSMIPR